MSRNPSWNLLCGMAALPLVLAGTGLTAGAAQAQTSSGVGGGAGSSPAPTIRAAAPKPGAKCPKKNKVVTTKKYGKLKCTKVGKKLVWKKVPKPVAKPVIPPVTPPAPPPPVGPTCAEGGTCAIGDTGPGGGKVFFRDMYDDIPTFRYLEAAPSDIGPGALCDLASWSGGLLPDLPYGVGEANTLSLATACGSGLADTANDLVSGGKDDWYVPSSEELELMFDNYALLGLSVPSQRYWSSTNAGPSSASAFGHPLAWANDFQPWTNTGSTVRPMRKIV